MTIISCSKKTIEPSSSSSNTIKQNLNNEAMWSMMNQNNQYNEESEDESSSLDDNSCYESDLSCLEDEDNAETITCACGKILSAGWDCIQCRSNCCSCHRALGPNEICNRCISVERNTDSNTSN
ncbi:hypothetical protein INT46_009289 [Mucor plumbeus]|uniref:Uncharacterized protein n=1 Tax=Mucor plumbeus TaxID=97098 RepID=A0A8H7R5D9_9FUNG|nr:hypothetical protein INT46_009289 [Mucor plumbeus]